MFLTTHDAHNMSLCVFYRIQFLNFMKLIYGYKHEYSKVVTAILQSQLHCSSTQPWWQYNNEYSG